MLGWAITFLIVALVAAVFGFGGIAGTAVEIAKLIFFVAIVLFAISAVIGLLRGPQPDARRRAFIEQRNAALRGGVFCVRSVASADRLKGGAGHAVGPEILDVLDREQLRRGASAPG